MFTGYDIILAGSGVRRMNVIKEKLALLPDKPGVYLMKDSRDNIIYVGKAKVIKNRVRSYFTGSHDGKTQKLVSEISDFEYIVTPSNVEALLLECNLIKKHTPRYNVMLRDDKTYPYLKLTREAHPRLEITRRVKKDKAHYFGPYPNAGAANETKKLLDRIYPLRKCRTIPDRVCLYYHLGQCLAPCEYEVDEAEYQQITKQITRFLKGGYQEIIKEIEAKMLQASEELQFEKAKEHRDQIQSIQQIMQKQSITVKDQVDRDVFGYAIDKGWLCVQVFFVRQGKLIERDVSILPYYNEDLGEALISYIGQFYLDKEHVVPKEILVPEIVDENVFSEWLQVKVYTPKRGQKKELLDMADQNAATSLQEKFQLIERQQSRTTGAIEGLGEALGTGPVYRIEAFDNSNIQGTDPVSAMVVFKDGKPARQEYRKYKIKQVEGPDDYDSMREVIRRRYIRLLKEGQPLPDLIMMDGGKGQMNAALDILENELGLYIPVCGLVKDEKHRSSHVLFGSPPEHIHLARDSQEFYLLQRIQDEVHRFAITFHRQRRTKSMIQSALDDVPGIGPKRKQKLLKHFGSVKKIAEASDEELKKLGLGEALALSLKEHLQSVIEERKAGG